jgi:hypothetical protein
VVEESISQKKKEEKKWKKKGEKIYTRMTKRMGEWGTSQSCKERGAGRSQEKYKGPYYARLNGENGAKTTTKDAQPVKTPTASSELITHWERENGTLSREQN